MMFNTSFTKIINLFHTINNSYPIKFLIEKRCVKRLHSCLSSDYLIISNIAKSSCDNCYSTFGDNASLLSHKSNIASTKWREPFNDLLHVCLTYLVVQKLILK